MLLEIAALQPFIPSGNMVPTTSNEVFENKSPYEYVLQSKMIREAAIDHVSAW